MKVLKALQITSLAMILALSFLGCAKTENAKPVIKTVTVDSVKIPDTPALTKTYPYTDTFAGALSISFYSQSSLDTAYRFYVRHANENTIEFIGSKSIQLQSGEARVTIDDTMVVSSAGLYHASIYLGNVGIVKNFYAQDAFLFLLSNGKLFVDWDFFLPEIGQCDEGENIGNFSGTPQ